MSTTQQQDIYASHAAFPIIASTLLPASVPQVESPPAAAAAETQTTNSATWNLEPSLFNAFSHASSQDSNRLLRCGTVIGLSYLREWDRPESDRNRDLLGDVLFLYYQSLVLFFVCLIVDFLYRFLGHCLHCFFGGYL